MNLPVPLVPGYRSTAVFLLLSVSPCISVLPPFAPSKKACRHRVFLLYSLKICPGLRAQKLRAQLGKKALEILRNRMFSKNYAAGKNTLIKRPDYRG